MLKNRIDLLQNKSECAPQILYKIIKSVKKFNQSIKILSLNLSSQDIYYIEKHKKLREILFLL